ncbi:MAG: F0F1 ATP synthase subunit B [Planctomycetota bacterium]|jgi:F-type H+-transporting ATPase subunit b|nr:F0F1 ATP synthase subunit B [Planctomycetota bacterium]MDP6761408.1 F0F1 ATP synthase subunit B [Planctomycetota bacterium]MDP6987888.1 F0F1 ATP synthase subunit B [Planctomycetota bacterium]
MTAINLILPESGGFNPLELTGLGNALWTWVIFLLTLPFAWIVILGPVSRALEDRDGRVREAIDSARQASEDAEKARAEVEVKLGEAQADAAKLLAEARERGEAREREILDSAREEAEAMRERAQSEIETAKEQALAAIRDEVVDLSLAAASQVLQRRVDSEDDRRMVGEMMGSAFSGGDSPAGSGS